GLEEEVLDRRRRPAGVVGRREERRDSVATLRSVAAWARRRRRHVLEPAQLRRRVVRRAPRAEREGEVRVTPLREARVRLVRLPVRVGKEEEIVAQHLTAAGDELAGRGVVDTAPDPAAELRAPKHLDEPRRVVAGPLRAEVTGRVLD